MVNKKTSLGQLLRKGHKRAVALAGTVAFSRRLYEASEKQPEHERMRSTRKLLRLSEKEYGYVNLKSGIQEEPIPDEWGYRPHELEKQLDEKMRLLPVRFRLLADDIRALDRYGRFESNQWKIT